MTITKDHTGKRKPSWESKISVCTASTRPVGRSERSDTPSSILSSDSDIRFTRKLGNQYRCGCCIVAGFLLFLLVAAIAVYLAYTFILSKSTDEKIFRVNFRITEGDAFHPKLADPSTEDFRVRARNYRERLNLIFRRSPLRPAFIKTDILALDGTEGEDLIVHFNVHFDSRRMGVSTTDLVDVLTREINLEESLYLSNLTIPADSLVVRENIVDMTTHLPVSTASTTLLPSTTKRPPRQCLPLQMSYCSNLPYNVTSYPNLMGHNSYSEVSDDVISFREIIDSECYRLAYDFVCHVLQPPCQKAERRETEDTMIMPCRSYCYDFVKSCGNRIPSKFKDAFECSKFPELSGSGQCVHKPGCVEELQSRGLEARLCDGVVDCPDLSDETSCSYCEENFIHCGVGRTCIPKSKQCDGLVDCPNGSDENNCLSVLPSTTVPKNIISTPHQHKYFDTGFVSYNSRGRVGKLCMDEYNDTNIIDVNETLREFASYMCKSASYENVISYRIEEDEETDNVQYVEMVGGNIFLPAPCPRRNILHIGCENLECGIQDLNPNFGVQGLNKMANHGDWPWHVSLHKDNVHLCDGTLMSDEWLLSTASCFQGQTKAEWVAKFGSVRLTSSSPWEQERRIVGMIKSPVEGSTLVLLKLDEPVAFSDFVRPVCLPDSKFPVTNYTYCTTLGWSKTREQVQRVDVKMSNMAMCENISITTVNSICTESVFSGMDCNEEEFAGSPLLCQKPGAKQWSLVGVSNWRIACQKQGTERPRLYDKTVPNIDWINQNILTS